MSIIVTWVDNGSPYVVPSAMSKAGIEVMTKSLAIEWARYGIRLNAVGPGEIPTEGMSKRLNPGEEPGARSKSDNPMAPRRRDERAAEPLDLPDGARPMRLAHRPEHLHGRRQRARDRRQLLRAAQWSDADWQVARERIEAQNAKDKLQRIDRRRAAPGADSARHAVKGHVGQWPTRPFDHRRGGRATATATSAGQFLNWRYGSSRPVWPTSPVPTPCGTCP